MIVYYIELHFLTFVDHGNVRMYNKITLNICACSADLIMVGTLARPENKLFRRFDPIQGLLQLKIGAYKTEGQTLYTRKQRGKGGNKCVNVSKTVNKNEIRIK